MKKLFILFALFAHVAAAQNVPNYVPTNGLVGWWPFNGNANDESGNSKHGTATGATLAPDRFNNVNQAYNFSQSGDKIVLPEISSLLGAPNVSSTYSMWFKGVPLNSSSTSTGQILTARESSNSYAIRFEVTSNIAPFYSGLRNKVYYRCPSENDEPTDSTIYDPNYWHNLIVIVDASTGLYKYYFDGVLKNSMSFSFNPSNNYYSANRVWQIGGTFPAFNSIPHQFFGQIDDIAIWTRALTYSELITLFNGCSDTLALNPTSATATVGTNATFTALSSASGATYQWQAKNGSNFVNVSNAGQFSGATSSTLTINSVTSANNGLQVRCIVDHGDCVDTSAIAVLSSCFAINSQPANQYVVPASSATFAVSTNDPSCTYQWQTNAGFGFQNLSNAGQFTGVTSNTLTVSTVSQANNNQLFRCLVSAGTCKDTTAEAKIVLSGVGVSENALMRVSVSPTPTRGLVDLGLTLEGTYSLIGIDGRTVQSGSLRQILDFSNQPAGIYSLRLETSAGSRVVKVVKE